MAQKRYSLAETSEDVLNNIESSENITVVDNKPTPEPIQVQDKKKKPIATQKPVIAEKVKTDRSADKSPTLPPEEASKEEVKETEKPSAASKKKKDKKLTASIVNYDASSKMNMRNVELDDETLWRLDTVKNKLNRARGENDPLVTQKVIIRTALLEWLDANYPDTKKAYQLINDL